MSPSNVKWQPPPHHSLLAGSCHFLKILPIPEFLTAVNAALMGNSSWYHQQGTPSFLHCVPPIKSYSSASYYSASSSPVPPITSPIRFPFVSASGLKAHQPSEDLRGLRDKILSRLFS